MSWTRDRLKTNGRIAFKKNYWSCVAVAVIMGIITGLSGVNGFNKLVTTKDSI